MICHCQSSRVSVRNHCNCGTFCSTHSEAGLRFHDATFQKIEPNRDSVMHSINVKAIQVNKMAELSYRSNAFK